jgi:Asp/Glu/hydantoin racemase
MPEILYHKIRPIVVTGQATYGEAIGILVFDTDFPRIPGDVGNATTFAFPVKFKVVRGIHPDQILCKDPDISVCHRFIEAAKELEAEGVRAVTTTCGYFVYFQDEIADAVNIPVFTSSLIQVPLVSKMLGKKRKRVGIICADVNSLTDTHLRKAGIDNSIPVAVGGLGRQWPNILTKKDPEERRKAFEKGLTWSTKKLVSTHPDIGAIVFECANMPPGAAAVQEATGLPVFDIVTLLNMIHDVVVRKRFSGHM